MRSPRCYAVVATFAMLAAVGVGCSSDPDLVIDPPPAGEPDAGPGKDSGTRPTPDSGTPECTAASECPEPTNECMERTCSFGECGEAPKAKGTVVSAQTAGDCKKNVCDGAGAVVAENDDTDVPNDDNDCTDDVCTGGVPSNPPKSSGAACGADSDLMCNGEGACVGCVDASDCSGDDTECRVRACDAGTCGFTNTPQGTPVTNQTDGDCKKNVCDGNGGVETEIDDSDVPTAAECREAFCTDGVASTPPKDKGAMCDGTDDGTACYGDGTCVAISCTDDVKGGDETDVDCGGDTCPACGDGKACTDNADCQSGVCTGSVCAEPACDDGVKNGDETDVDCGGSCGSCVKVDATMPADGATDASASSTIAVTFTAAMDPATLTAQAADGACSGSVQVSSDDFATCIGFAAPVVSAGDTVVTLTPAAALAAGTTYKIRVTSAAKDAGGSAFAGYTSPAGFTTLNAESCAGANVVISQVYGGGGNKDAQYTHDFVELFNRGMEHVTLEGCSLQYASAAGNFVQNANQKTDLIGTIAPGGYFLVQLAADARGDGDALPTPDLTGDIPVAASNGKIALVRTTTKISSCKDTSVIDTVGFGTANCFEGANAATAGSNTTALHRKESGCQDTDDNGNDFVAAAPAPRNSASPANVCAPVGP